MSTTRGRSWAGVRAPEARPARGGGYSGQDLGVVGLFTRSAARGINSAGEIVGQQLLSNGTGYAFHWTASSGWTSLITGKESQGRDNSDERRVVSDSAGLPFTLWLGQLGSSKEYLPGLGRGGGGQRSAIAMNTCGVIAGSASHPGSGWRAVVWNRHACDQ